MDNEVYSFALKNTLNEIRNVCPEVSSTFIFKEDGEIVAHDENTDEKTVVRVVDSFDDLLETANAIGGIEAVILQGNKGKVSVSCINDLYLVTVTSKKADDKYVNTITRVLIPTVLKLLEQIHPACPENNSKSSKIEQTFSGLDEEKDEDPVDLPIEESTMEEPEKEKETETEPDSVLPEPPVNQLLVENLGGLLVPSDTVRVENAVIDQWKELYGEKRIEEVEIETFSGKTVHCKFKPIKGSKYEGKGIIQMPEKIRLTLDTKKGELVRVKPVVE